jgi:aspartate kinase
MIVIKFGGTSVEDARAIGRVAGIVRGRLRHRPVVVVSAMAKVTDQLLAMGRAAGCGDLPSALERSRAVRQRHLNTVQELACSRSAQLCTELERDFDQLDELLKGIAAVGELTPRTTDYVVSFGEALSSKIVNAAFQARGIDSTLVDSRECVITDANYTQAAPLLDETNARMLANVKPLVDTGRVVVMAGFIASTLDGVPTTLGRGGSDFSAAIVGAALDAECIEIWTDVNGMMTTDPRMCPQARRINVVSFDEAAEMAFFGAKVLHPATLLPAVQKNIPVYVLNSRNPKNKGTCVRKRTPGRRGSFTAIATKKNVSIVSIVSPRMLLAHGYLHKVFEVFDRHRCPVDIVSTSEVSVSLTVDSNRDIDAIMVDLRRFADATCEDKKAIVCLIGENIRGTPGVLAKVFTAVAEGGVNVRMVSQGASEINISFVIEEADVAEAVRHLHARFFETPARGRAKLAGKRAAWAQAVTTPVV